MVCSVIRSVTRTIYASDLVLRKESPVPPIIQLLPALTKPAERLVLSVSRPLHVSSVENLNFRSATKCEAMVVEEGKSIIGVYLATWWALQNVGVFNICNTNEVLNSLNASLLACAWGSLSLVMLMNISSSSKDDKSSRSPSMSKTVKKFFYPKHMTKLINDSNSDIEFWVQQAGEDFFDQTLKAKDEIYMRRSYYNFGDTSLPTKVILKANGKCQKTFTPEDFLIYQKFVFNMDANGKLVVTNEERA